MKKFIERFKYWYTEWRFQRTLEKAIDESQRLANEQRRKFVVVMIDGKPTAIAKKQCRLMLKTKKLTGSKDVKGATLFEAIPDPRY